MMKKIAFVLFLFLSCLHAEETFHALKGGVLSHGEGPISSGKEDGIDMHAELLFKSKVLNAYPALGADINLKGNTSFVYGGLAWEGKFFDHILVGAFLGLAVHDGELDRSISTKRQFGTRFLFREAIEIGVYLNDKIALSLMYDHSSNAGLDNKRNQGNDNMGLRLSYYF